MPRLIADGAEIVVTDPEGRREGEALLGSDVIWAEDAYAAASGADALVILTEWNHFRALDLGRLRRLLKRPLLIDLRNVYGAEEAARVGLDYHSIGRRSGSLA